MATQFKKFKLEDICRAASSKNSLIKGKQIQEFQEGLYPAYSASGQDIWREEYKYEGNAIIVSAVGARCGKCFRADGKWTAIANTHIIFPKEGIDRDYLFYNVNKESFWEKGGLAQPFVKIKDTLRRKSISIPVDSEGNPDVKEQKRIVTLLKETEELKRKRAEADQKITTVIPALFQHMFDVNREKWTKKKLSECISIGTKLVDPKKEEFCDLPQVGPENIVSGTGEIVNVKSAKQKRVISNNFIFTDQHILYSKIRPYLNKIAYPGFGGLCSADTYPLLPKIDLINPYFLLSVLRGEQFLSYANGMSQRLRMPKLNKEQLSNYDIVLPPIELQNQFAEKVKEIQSLLIKQKESATKIEELFSSLLARAMTNYG